MAKTIKFNLICDDKPIRTIEDLQNNFSIEDILIYYNNKLLQRWLDVRGYADEFEKVNAITVEKPIEVVKELIKIFNVVCDDKKVEESVYILEFLKERKELYSIYEKENYKSKSIIDDYETGYRQLVEGILENPYDIAKIKASINNIVENYEFILKLNYRELFYTLLSISPLAVMCLIMNEKSRIYFLPASINTGETGLLDIEINADKKNIYNEICKMISGKNDIKNTKGSSSSGSHYGLSALLGFKVLSAEEISNPLESFGDNLHSFSGITDGYWKDLEPKGKRYMIISMENGDYVRSSGNTGGDLGYQDIWNKFVIVDGIDYKSNSDEHKLLYMEV